MMLLFEQELKIIIDQISFFYENKDLLKNVLHGAVGFNSGKEWVERRIIECKNEISKLEEEIKDRDRRIILEKEKISDMIEKKFMTYDDLVDLLPSCEICLEKYDTNEHWESCITVCGHKFGKSCIEKNFETSKRCPKCDKLYEKENIITLF
ncbi:Oidioi.mRNA.OKI2018_I69.chr1.g998.t1.cds [Oikopleura dioica]|uniref:Oidioi.mRNA.OKI2018_I69.chr1.g998.t1.cds n=1 Tax=Oikopleura dioica TaxID=34765 RepID=A0ABN7SRS6_OIKDI|nr:Oidioi.mRNA.OKI2018_I69.chr1.g998.t1.cds [Oikopleura dioica]